MTIWGDFIKGIWRENPTLVLLLGMCPTLALTSSAINGLSMGLATTFVLIGSNCVVSLVKNIVPNKIRIPVYIVIIASFVTVVDMLMKESGLKRKNRKEMNTPRNNGKTTHV